MTVCVKCIYLDIWQKKIKQVFTILWWKKPKLSYCPILLISGNIAQPKKKTAFPGRVILCKPCVHSVIYSRCCVDIIFQITICINFVDFQISVLVHIHNSISLYCVVVLQNMIYFKQVIVNNEKRVIVYYRLYFINTAYHSTMTFNLLTWNLVLVTFMYV